MNGDLDEIARAELVEREPCPRCGAAPGSACRANSGVVAVDYHTGRYAKVPGLKTGPAIRIPAARGPGRPWQPGPEPDPGLLAAVERTGDRIGYARVSSKGQDLTGQVRALKEAECVRIYVEKVGTREKIRPEYNAALAELRPADTLTVTMLDRLGRNMVELITSAQDLAERGHRLEIRTGPLAGTYDPQGAGKVLFVVFAAMAEVEREFIHERTLVGLDTAAATCSPSPCGAATRRSPSQPSPHTSASAAPPCTAPSPRTTKLPPPRATGDHRRTGGLDQACGTSREHGGGPRHALGSGQRPLYPHHRAGLPGGWVADAGEITGSR